VLEYGSDISRSQGDVHFHAHQARQQQHLRAMQAQQQERDRLRAAASASTATGAAPPVMAATVTPGAHEPVLEGATKSPAGAFSHFLGADSSEDDDEEEEADLHFAAARDDHDHAHATADMAAALMAPDRADDEAVALHSGGLQAPPEESVALSISRPGTSAPPTLLIPPTPVAVGGGKMPFMRVLSIDTRDADDGEEAEAEAVDVVLGRADPPNPEDVVAVALDLQTAAPAAASAAAPPNHTVHRKIERRDCGVGVQRRDGDPAEVQQVAPV